MTYLGLNKDFLEMSGESYPYLRVEEMTEQRD